MTNMADSRGSPAMMALYTTFESPAKSDWRMPSSTINWIAICAIRASSTYTNEGKEILLDKAARTSPFLLRTTTSILASLVSSKITPS